MELTIDFVNTFFLRAYEEPPDGRTIHRYVQPGQSLLIGRPAGKYHELDKENVDWDSFDHTPRQQPKKPDPAKAKETMRDLWGTFTEEQVKRRRNDALDVGQPWWTRMYAWAAAYARPNASLTRSIWNAGMTPMKSHMRN